MRQDDGPRDRTGVEKSRKWVRGRQKGYFGGLSSEQGDTRSPARYCFGAINWPGRNAYISAGRNDTLLLRVALAEVRISQPTRSMCEAAGHRRTIRLEIFYGAGCREAIIVGIERDGVLHHGKRGKRAFRRRIPEKPVGGVVRPITCTFPNALTDPAQRAVR